MSAPSNLLKQCWLLDIYHIPDNKFHSIFSSIRTVSLNKFKEKWTKFQHPLNNIPICHILAVPDLRCCRSRPHVDLRTSLFLRSTYVLESKDFRRSKNTLTYISLFPISFINDRYTFEIGLDTSISWQYLPFHVTIRGPCARLNNEKILCEFGNMEWSLNPKAHICIEIKIGTIFFLHFLVRLYQLYRTLSPTYSRKYPLFTHVCPPSRTVHLPAEHLPGPGSLPEKEVTSFSESNFHFWKFLAVWVFTNSSWRHVRRRLPCINTYSIFAYI